MNIQEFAGGYDFPIPRRGFTSIEAAEFLKREYPQVEQWTCWAAGGSPYGRALRKIVGRDFSSSGNIRGWLWERVPTAYPVVAYWTGPETGPGEGDQWVGMLKIRGPNREGFLLFSCLCSTGVVGRLYFASTQDGAVLDRFARDVYHHFHPAQEHGPQVHVFGGHAAEFRLIELAPEDCLPTYLPDGMMEDIEQQVYLFFENDDWFEELHIPHRRGLLFVGSPGTGKTKMLRHLIRQCHARYRAPAWMLQIRRETSTETVECFFDRAASEPPALVILEDMDSLATESGVTRAALLSQLDGLGTQEGLLIIGTTNNPREIDPALIHRPSRFDRVWHFPLPDFELRYKYLLAPLEGIDTQTTEMLARQTSGWSFAYLRELRVTAAMTALNRNHRFLTEEILMEAFELLAAQFRAGRANHAIPSSECAVGFLAV